MPLLCAFDDDLIPELLPGFDSLLVELFRVESLADRFVSILVLLEVALKDSSFLDSPFVSEGCLVSSIFDDAFVRVGCCFVSSWD